MKVTASSDLILLSMIQEAINFFAGDRKDDDRKIVTRRSVYVTEGDEPGEAQMYSLNVEEAKYRVVAVALVPESKRETDNGNEVIPVIVQFYEGAEPPKSAASWQRNIMVPVTIDNEEAFEKFAPMIASLTFHFLLDGTLPPIVQAH